MGEGGTERGKENKQGRGRRQKDRLKSQAITVVPPPRPPRFAGQEKLSAFGTQEVTSQRQAEHRK